MWSWTSRSINCVFMETKNWVLICCTFMQITFSLTCQTLIAYKRSGLKDHWDDGVIMTFKFLQISVLRTQERYNMRPNPFTKLVSLFSDNIYLLNINGSWHSNSTQGLSKPSGSFTSLITMLEIKLLRLQSNQSLHYLSIYCSS